MNFEKSLNLFQTEKKNRLADFLLENCVFLN